MSKIEKLSATWHGLLPILGRVIGDWKPSHAEKELTYRNSLLEYLRTALPDDTIIEKEYRHFGTTIDIWIKWKGLFVQDTVAIELKVNLTKKTEYDRLVGQLEQLEPNKHKTIVVLIGTSDEQFVKRLTTKYADQITPPVISVDPTMLVLRIPNVTNTT